MAQRAKPAAVKSLAAPAQLTDTTGPSPAKAERCKTKVADEQEEVKSEDSFHALPVGAPLDSVSEDELAAEENDFDVDTSPALSGLGSVVKAEDMALSGEPPIGPIVLSPSGSPTPVMSPVDGASAAEGSAEAADRKRRRVAQPAACSGAMKHGA